MVDTNSVVIVALPDVNDPVNKYSSEKKPHLTMLYLGDQLTNEQVMQAALHVEHVASLSRSFGLTVDRRGTLGDDDADVLFFEKDKYGFYEQAEKIRSDLLMDSAIKLGYNTADQYPSWTPHLTMGYPERPAKVDDREYSGFSHVSFTRLAIWLGDSEGPEFRLDGEDRTIAPTGDMYMSAEELGAAYLAHYGKKGMQWGIINEEDGTAVPSGTRKVDHTEAENRADPDGPDRRAQVKKAALIAGGVALAAGVAYGAHKYGQSGGLPGAKSATEAVKKTIQEPTSLIYLARAKNKGLTFHSMGDTPDYFSVFDKMGLNGEVPIGFFEKASDGTGKIAARLLDPLGRADFAGRPISHDFVIPRNMSDGIDSIDDVRDKIWPTVRDGYQKFWDQHESARHSDEGGESMTAEDTGKAFLAHYGVKGMKWGVTKSDAGSGGSGKTSLGTRVARTAAAANASNAAIKKGEEKLIFLPDEERKRAARYTRTRTMVEASKLNESAVYKGKDLTKDPALFDRYSNELSKKATAIYKDELSKARNAALARVTRSILSPEKDKVNLTVPTNTVRHADGEEEREVILTLNLTRNSTGHVTSIAEESPELKHYGVKGMKWGVTKNDRAAQKTPTPVEVTQKTPGTLAKAKGGANLPAHSDAINALAGRQKARSSTTDALSNAELRQVIDRMRLEQQYSELSFNSDRRSAGQKFVQGFFGKSRYKAGEKRRFTDEDERAGEVSRDAANEVARLLKEKSAAKAAASQ